MAFTTSPPWYANGTVATDGTTKITGTATNWTDVGKIALGDMITLDGSTFYQIQQIGDGTNTQAANNTTIIVDRTIPTGTGQSYSILQFSAINPANSDIAYKVSAMVQAWQGREDELRAWLAGASGTFPLTDATGVTYQVKSPAQMQADVDNTIASALNSKNTPDGVVAMDHKSRVSTNGYLIPAIDSALPISSIVDHDFFDNTQDSAWIDQCADKSWELEPRATGKHYLAASYANDAAALAVNPSIVNGDVYYTGSVFNEYGVGATTRAGSRKHPMRGVATVEAARAIIWDITSGSPEMWMVFDATSIFGSGWSTAAYITVIAGSITSCSIQNGILCVGTAGNTYGLDGLLECRFVSDNAVVWSNYGSFSRTQTQNIASRNTQGLILQNLPPIVNSTVNSVAITYLPDAPLDDYGMRVPTIAVGTAGDGTNTTSIIKHDGTVVNISADGGFNAIKTNINQDGYLSVLRSDGTMFVWNAINGLTTGQAPDATYTGGSGIPAIAAGLTVMA